jgi:arachidonate 15-lipoxygenase
MGPKGGVDAVMATPIEVSRQTAILGAKQWRFDQAALPRALHLRGLDDRYALPDAPYRDDAELVWSALHDWVESYVRLYYSSHADVQQDTELQRFFTEVGAQDGGRISGVRPVNTVDHLVDALTLLIFTGSAQHAAVNFPQYDLMSFVPNFPLAAFRPGPGASAVKEGDYVAMLPPMDIAQHQSMLGHLLGGLHHTRLGHYKGVFTHFAHDARTEAPLKAFLARLEQVELIIQERNRSRTSYTYLLPSRIPQGINI